MKVLYKLRVLKNFLVILSVTTYRINVLDINAAVSFSSSVATTTATIDGAINTAASINVSSTSAINASVTTTGLKPTLVR